MNILLAALGAAHRHSSSSLCEDVLTAPIISPLTLGLAVSKADEKLTADIYDCRLLRLQTKVRYLKQKIPCTLDQEETEQLEQARDYFENRTEYFKEKNK